MQINSLPPQRLFTFTESDPTTLVADKGYYCLLVDTYGPTMSKVYSKEESWVKMKVIKCRAQVQE